MAAGQMFKRLIVQILIRSHLGGKAGGRVGRGGEGRRRRGVIGLHLRLFGLRLRGGADNKRTVGKISWAFLFFVLGPFALLPLAVSARV